MQNDNTPTDHIIALSLFAAKAHLLITLVEVALPTADELEADIAL